MNEFPVIIIGGGIGGITTAAYLSQSGISFILLEQNNTLGGRCSTRTINGNSYEIGALYVGGRVFDHLRNTFNVDCKTILIRGAIKIGNRFICFPFGVRTVFDIIKCGVPFYSLVKFLSRTKILKSPSTFLNLSSIGEVIDSLTDESRMRTFLFSLFGVSGVSPYRISSQSLAKNSIIGSYKGLNPEYLLGGNGDITSLLAKIAEKNGQIIHNVKVNKILLKNGAVFGVQTENEIYKSQIVVSNSGIRNTVLELTERRDRPESFYSKICDLKSSLMVVNIFLTFSRKIELPIGVSIFLMPYNSVKEFELLENGQFPEKSMFILHVPSNLNRDNVNKNNDHRATLQFYYPRGNVEKDVLKKQVDKILNEGLDDLFYGLSKAIKEYYVYDPLLYKEKFGFFPYVFGVTPDLHSDRISIKTPIKNLYCVGDSVEPEGPCVPQAFESGLRTAHDILNQIES